MHSDPPRGTFSITGLRVRDAHRCVCGAHESVRGFVLARCAEASEENDFFRQQIIVIITIDARFDGVQESNRNTQTRYRHNIVDEQFIHSSRRCGQAAAARVTQLEYSLWCARVLTHHTHTHTLDWNRHNTWWGRHVSGPTLHNVSKVKCARFTVPTLNARDLTHRLHRHDTSGQFARVRACAIHRHTTSSQSVSTTSNQEGILNEIPQVFAIRRPRPHHTHAVSAFMILYTRMRDRSIKPRMRECGCLANGARSLNRSGATLIYII